MCHVSDRLRRLSADDDGFTLVEILVALVLFALMTTAATPMIITSLRASTVAKMDTGARQLTQERFETLRNLPFSVPPTSSMSVITNVPDLLDQYYPNGSAGLLATGVESSGYVGNTARRAGEPTSGPFYRTAVTSVAGNPRYAQFIAVQFLNSKGSAVTPPSTWTTAATDARPPSLSVGVTVTTRWTVGQLSKNYTTFTEIGEGRSQAPIVVAQARSSALRVSSTHNGADLLLEGGIVNSDANVTSGTSAAVNAQGASAALVPGLRADGIARTAVSPPGGGAGVDVSDSSPRELVDGAQVLARFGSTHVKKVRASTASGDVATGADGVPVESYVNSGGDFRFDNGPTVGVALGLAAGRPVLSATSSTSGSEVARTMASSRSVGTGTKSVLTKSEMSVASLDLLPVQLDGMTAPTPLLRVQLDTSSITCTSSAATKTVAATFTGSVSHLNFDAVTGSYGYTTYALDQEKATDPLLAADLRLPTAANPGHGLVIGTLGGQPRYLGQYVTGLRSLAANTAATLATVQDRRVQADLSGFISVATVPLRTSDSLSAVNVELGKHSCVVEDTR